ncbi:DCP2 [Coprinopsis cinerea AmutBmut pab1-1]|nr:DCP2 [Coprinopsis cinerea AmutBmut pab1-1]
MASSSPELPAPFAAETVNTFSYKDATEEEILEDLTSRFILNLPDEELASLERICFQVEQAHWYYDDFIREQNPKCPSLPLKKFTAMMFTHCPILQHWNHEEAFEKFMAYKTKVPVCGAIMLNSTWDKCVLVKGWKSSSGWGFPKGKINEVEEKHLCAVREVLEETGYNLAGKINPTHYLETVNGGQLVTLFVVPGVPEDYPFRTKTRKEISKIEWFRLVDLPGWKRNKQPAGKFYLISPFVGPLKAWINAHKPKKGRKGCSTESATPKKVKSPVPVPIPPSEPDALQDSSSQSSSMDNGDPQTPSPLHAESTGVKIVGEEGMANDHPDSQQMESMDPQLARLLTGLTLSANAAPSDKAGLVPQNNPQLGNVSSTTTSSISTIVPIPPAPEPVHGPNQPAQQDPGAQSASNAVVTSPGPSEAKPMSPTNSTLAPRSPVVRKATADISPYLSRATATPLSARQLQQLALLESVANESARRTPAIAGNALTPDARSLPPTTSPSLSRPNIASTGHFHANHTTGPQPLPPLPNNFDKLHPLQDVMARSRTSQGVHRGGHHAPGTMSMNQHQLLSLINGGRPNAPPSSPPSHFSPPYPTMFGMPQPMYPPGPQAIYQPNPSFPPHFQHDGPPHPDGLNPMLRPRPFSTAPMPPGPSLATKPINPSASALLSLLTSNPVPAQQPQGMPAPLPVPPQPRPLGPL